jgi:hypothetical protein
MGSKLQLCLLLATAIGFGFFAAGEAKNGFMSFGGPTKQTAPATPPPDNLAEIVGWGGESYPLHGVGGIKVTGGHHGGWCTNKNTSGIEIDGSGVSAQKYSPVNVSNNFAASPNNAYFVSDTAVCTLPTAAGCAAQEILVCNTGPNCTVTYQVAPGEMLLGGDQSGSGEANKIAINKRQGKVDKFISDGKSWYKE